MRGDNGDGTYARNDDMREGSHSESEKGGSVHSVTDLDGHHLNLFLVSLLIDGLRICLCYLAAARIHLKSSIRGNHV